MRIGIAVAAGCVALVVAGCASASGAAGAPGGSAATARLAQTPQQIAEADAASMLAAFRAPPGARRSGAINVTELSQPADTPATPDLIIRTGWWRVPGTTPAVAGWIAAHPPAGFTTAGWGTLGAGSTMAANRMFTLPPVPNVIFQRFLDVSVASAGSDSTAIRVDSEVAWLPAKPAAERIPAAAKMVTIVALSGRNPVRGQTVTITNTATVAGIANVIDDLPLLPPGTFSCPTGTDRALLLTFRAAASGPVLATVTDDLLGCGAVSVIIHGERLPTLWHANEMAQQVLKLAGLRWAGYS